MAYGGPDLNDYSLPAAADLSTHQYKFMTIDANGRGTIATSGTDVLIGILQNKPSAQDAPARIRPMGNISKLVAGEALAEGALITSNAQGFGTATVTDTLMVGAVCLAAVGGSADVADVLVVLYQHA